MLDFKEANKYFDNEQFSSLDNRDGRCFLKLRSMARKDNLLYLAKQNKIKVDNVPAKNLLEYLYNKRASLKNIEKTITEIFERERRIRKRGEDDLINELYKLKSFDWGGLHQNALERNIVDNYVKKIRSFDEINKKIDNEIHSSLKGYVQCSWYNNWTSIIIEDIFRDHQVVLPAIGKVKKIDYFIKEIPFDLKVTYFPETFISSERKKEGIPDELKELKAVSKALKIKYQRLSSSKLLEDLWQKIYDHPDRKAKECIKKLLDYRKNLVRKTMNDPGYLIKWLYENQGVRRFDAGYRFFLILVDINNFFDSWKLKRAKPLLSKEINKYLNDLPANYKAKDVEFSWEGKNYRTKSDIVFVLQDN